MAGQARLKALTAFRKEKKTYCTLLHFIKFSKISSLDIYEDNTVFTVYCFFFVWHDDNLLI